MQVLDINNNPLPTEVTMKGDGDPLTVYAMGDDGAPLSCFWVLSPAGSTMLSPKGVTFVDNKTGFFGTLSGFSSPTWVSIITVGPSYSTSYLPPTDQYLWHGDIKASLVAISTSGGQSRQLMIRAIDPRRGNGF